ncbi:hypothetical protein IYY11_05490 [Methylocystis sp. H62]|uniref:hypothetical protein n=1 Tax=Methylocystis sp. H62 TaxID=2785789 RepID=UPI0018C2384B|nr:hypothetical protein [Methylocystis sp. H62]MBG0792857.1 hypothetical protein [Methylocystis sp. H62]
MIVGIDGAFVNATRSKNQRKNFEIGIGGERSVRWNVWHYGKSHHARWMIALSRLGAQLLSHRKEIDAAGGDLSKIEAAYKRFDELQRYLYSNIGSLTDYGRARRQGERIATANIESTVNQLINQCMCKKRQMRWSRLGAQLMLHVRTAHLNGILARYCGLLQPVEWTWPNDTALRQAA